MTKAKAAILKDKPATSRTYRRELRDSEKRYRDLLFHLPVGVYRTTPEGRIIAANPALVRMLGYAGEKELLDVNVWDLYLKTGDRDAHIKKLEKRRTYFSDFKLKRRDGRTIWGRDYPRAVEGADGRIAYFDGILVDIGPQKRAEARLKSALAKLAGSQLEREAMIRKLEETSITDDLTGLYNRRGFFTVCREFIALAARRSSKMNLVFMDLDDLKGINDTHGHHAGDEALRKIAECLKGTFRSSDLKGRMGGDEFAVFSVDSDPQGVEIALARLRRCLGEFNAAGTEPFRLSLSTGTAGYDPAHPETIEELLKRADRLMYEAKRNKPRP